MENSASSSEPTLRRTETSFDTSWQDLGTSAGARPRPALPDRYRRAEDAADRFSCAEAPTVSVHLERGFCVTAAGVRSARSGSIFLDGAGQGPPLVDNEREVLNLDHHEDCVRPFTLSTCEQAFVLVAKGFDFESRDWEIHANEPDLDTMLALWVLLNHRRVRNPDDRLRQRLVPLLKVEGAIDTHGMVGRQLTGLSPDLEERAFQELEELIVVERELKQRGEWSEVDFVAYALDRLRAIDRMIYRPEDFAGKTPLYELARAELPNRNLVIACRSELGIYRVEEDLQEVYGDRLGLVVLEKEPGTYTLRKVKAFTHHTLDRCYDWLNLIDPGAGNSGSGERWGGSEEIGGSPRSRGSKLGPQKIVDACARALSRPRPMERVRVWLGSLTASLALCSLAALVAMGSAFSVAGPATVLAGALLYLFFLRSTPGLAGLRSPILEAQQLLGFLPVIAGGLAGGVWLPRQDIGPGQQLVSWSSLLLFAIGTEVLFRGVVSSRMLGLERGRTRGWLSSAVLWPALLSALWVIAWTRLFGSAPLPIAGFGLPAFETLPYLTAAAVGFGLSWLRLRSESLVTPIVAHLTAAALALSLV